jgi:methanogenic corrinoid protein MtbC1
LFGVDSSTIRRWTMTNKIKCSVTAGGHRTFQYNHIIDFAKKHGAKFIAKNKKNINKAKSIEQIINSSLALSQDSIDQIFIELYLHGIQLATIMDDYIEESLIAIQHKLDLKEISVAEEHIARKIISKSLNTFRKSITKSEETNNKNILCLNLENDIPDLPIDMIQILLENDGFTVHNSGSHTSIDNLKLLVNKTDYEAIFIYLCNRQCCTATVESHINDTNLSLKEIAKIGKEYKIKLFLGGPSTINIEPDVIKDYKQFTNYADPLTLIK